MSMIVGISKDYGPDYYQGMDSAPLEGWRKPLDIILKGAENEGRNRQMFLLDRKSAMAETL